MISAIVNLTVQLLLLVAALIFLWSGQTTEGFLLFGLAALFRIENKL